MVSVTLNKVRGEFARAGLRGVVTATLARPGRWVRAYRELGAHRSFDHSAALVAYTRALASGWFDPFQLDTEICALLDRVRFLQPKVVLEIGTANGGTLFMFTRVAAEDAVLISIDLPGGAFGGGYPRWRAPLYRRFALPRQSLYLLRGDSHSQAIISALKQLLNGRSIDLLFIDGDHTYAGVRSDHEVLSPLVRHGGLVALHDIHPIADGVTEVPRYWCELRHAVGGVEVIADADQQGSGIGLYEVGARVCSSP
ncbi:class I SAM-dependent methyltransferase [uncultured Lamprocystis sp.]|uniref:class I SAM-dependent methyltransferase n=1 Tax=uncultured Lamprocystis sp. TaxID=543132 RepID=UPI003418CA6D